MTSRPRKPILFTPGQTFALKNIVLCFIRSFKFLVGLIIICGSNLYACAVSLFGRAYAYVRLLHCVLCFLQLKIKLFNSFWPKNAIFTYPACIWRTCWG